LNVSLHSFEEDEGAMGRQNPKFKISYNLQTNISLFDFGGVVEVDNR
jgi:hypothetical protein